jgi:soluble lytic murein transglycosylase-like protein
VNGLFEIVEIKSLALGADPAIIKAICKVESNFNPNAIRFEPGFLQRYVPAVDKIKAYPGCSRETERQAQAMSWGLMQIMGYEARQRGFEGTYLSELCSPETGLEYGIRHWLYKLRRADGDPRRALLAWNGGGNSEYPGLVLSKLSDFA